MSFTILLLSPDADPSWPEKIRAAVPGAVAKIYADPKDALADIETADAAYGTVPPELFARAKKLRWICASRAGLGGAYFHDALVNSDVVVTGMHGSYNEHLSTHAIAFLLAFARRFDHYLPQKRWQRGPGMIDLPTKTVLIVGVGGAGSEASKQCAAFGMRVLGIDPRVTEPPAGMADLGTSVATAECADHAACRDPRHPLSPKMGSDTARKLPALRCGSAADQRRRQGKMVLTAIRWCADRRSRM